MAPSSVQILHQRFKVFPITLASFPNLWKSMHVCTDQICQPHQKLAGGFEASNNEGGLSRFHIGRESIVSKSEIKRREAVWDLFQSEIAFLIDHLMVLKNVSYKEFHLVQ